MTWFNFCSVNHDDIGKSTLFDMFEWLRVGLTEAGHLVTYSERNFEYKAINLIWENFNDFIVPQLAINTNYRWGIIATELPTEYTFNYRTEPEWINRFNNFYKVAPYADFIWTMIEDSVKFYSNFAPTKFVELGFSNYLYDSHRTEEPLYDFCFWGLMTPYRRNALDELSKYSKVLYCEKFISSNNVLNIIRASKICINFKQSELWPIPSPTRLGRIMHGSRIVACEYVTNPTRQGLIAGICPIELNFYEYCLSLLIINSKQHCDNVIEEYEHNMPMKSICCDLVNFIYADTLLTISDIDMSIYLSNNLPPKLIKSFKNFNVVYFNSFYYILQKSDGPIDLHIEGHKQFLKFSRYEEALLFYSYIFTI
jgi:hypothetical protein